MNFAERKSSAGGRVAQETSQAIKRRKKKKRLRSRKRLLFSFCGKNSFRDFSPMAEIPLQVLFDNDPMPRELDNNDHENDDDQEGNDDAQSIAANLQIIHLLGQLMDLLVV